MSSQPQSRMVDEHSPLIAAEDSGLDEDIEDGTLSEVLDLEDSIVESKSALYLLLLTLSIGGLQIVWSVELSHGSPYLLSLGMSKALLAFVWLAGPLTGVLVQPYIGIISDRCRISWGKRKPFMVAGTLGTIVSSLILSYSKDIIWVLGPWTRDAEYGGWWMGLTISLATIMMWCLDFSINTVQAAIRAFIVDNAPAHQQESANAWASRITGVGNVLGYIFGYLDLPKYFYFFGNTQFKVLCVIASLALSSTVVISVAAIRERNPQDDPPVKSNAENTGLLGFFRQVYKTTLRLSPTVRRVCEIQFFHWIGWFPFLFYITTYIGQLYVNPRLTPGMTKEEIDALWDKATRVGTLALLIYAIVSMSANIILPVLIVPTYEKQAMTGTNGITPSMSSNVYNRLNEHTDSYGEVTRTQSSSNLSSLSHSNTSRGYSRSMHSVLSGGLLKRVQIPGLTLRRAWLMSQLLHVLCVFSTFFISSTIAGTIMVALVGISWALTSWAPFAFISADIAVREQERRSRRRFRGAETVGLTAPSQDQDDPKTPLPGSYDDNTEQDSAGIILGLHNVAVSAPQIIATLISSIIFKMLQKNRNEPGDTSVAWTLRVGALSTLVAAYLTWKMKDGS